MPGSSQGHGDAQMTTLGARHLEVKPLSDAIGAEITTVDLANVSPSLHAQIRAALLDRHLLVFRDQHLTAPQIQAFAEMFGELEAHVIVVPVIAALEDDEQVSIAEQWNQTDDLEGWEASEVLDLVRSIGDTAETAQLEDKTLFIWTST